MKRLFIISFFFLASIVAIAQGKYIDKQGVIVFEASEKTFEPVKAKNTAVTAILDTSTGEIASLALLKEFMFKNALMQEHFNENYMESDTYPKAIFRGKLIGFSSINLSNSSQNITLEGVLSLRGKEKAIKTQVAIIKKGKTILLSGKFEVKPQDFDIEIPKIVSKKIAKIIKVQFNFTLKEK